MVGHTKYKIMLKINEKYMPKWRRRMLHDKRFTIISNNCWGGYIYRLFGLPYQSPTIGLFIMPEDYIKLVKNLEYYLLKNEISFISPEESKHKNELCNHEGFGSYPIGRLDDIEIFFVHYKDEKEAKEKWDRRLKRVNWDNLIIKFNDQNGCTEKQIMEFNKITKHKKMICFVAKKLPGEHNIYMREFKKDGYVVDDKYWLPQHINIIRYLNKKQ